MTRGTDFSAKLDFQNLQADIADLHRICEEGAACGYFEAGERAEDFKRVHAEVRTLKASFDQVAQEMSAKDQCYLATNVVPRLKSELQRCVLSADMAQGGAGAGRQKQYGPDKNQTYFASVQKVLFPFS